MTHAYVCFAPIIREGRDLKIGKYFSITKQSEHGPMVKVGKEFARQIINVLVEPFDAYGKLDVQYIPGRGIVVDSSNYGRSLGAAASKRLRQTILQLNMNRVHFKTEVQDVAKKEVPRLKVTFIIG